MRFLTCEPNLYRLANYTDEADVFYRNPGAWLKENYFGENATESLPTHFVMFDELFVRLPSMMNQHRSDYDLCVRFFHTHFPEGRVSTYVVVMCRTEWIRRSAGQMPLMNASNVYRQRGVGR